MQIKITENAEIDSYLIAILIVKSFTFEFGAQKRLTHVSNTKYSLLAYSQLKIIKCDS